MKFGGVYIRINNLQIIKIDRAKQNSKDILSKFKVLEARTLNTEI